jgi:hypothetical protein
MHPWNGPLRILNLPSENNAKLQFMNGKKLTPVVHVSRLKKYITPKRPLEDISVEDDPDLSEIFQEATDSQGKQAEGIYRRKEKNQENRKLNKKKKKKQVIELTQDDVMDIQDNIEEKLQGGEEEDIDAEEQINMEDEWEVEEIIQHKYINEELFYLVKWKGYSDRDCTWESEANCRHAEDMVKEYRRGCLNKCDECTFLSMTKAGLRSHKTKHHKG